MRSKALTSTVLLATLVVGCIEPCPPVTTAVADPTFSPPSQDITGCNEVHISRTYENAFGHMLIEAAEAEPAHEGDDFVISSFGIDLLDPATVNAEVLDHLIGRVDALKRCADCASILTYTAIVEKHDTYRIGGTRFDDVYVVTMHLYYSNLQRVPFGSSIGYDIERVVVFDSDGILLEAFGDGEHVLIVGN